MAANANLDPTLESFVNELVASGRFESHDAVVQEALRLFKAREARSSALDVAIARGLADVEAGRVRPASEVFDELEARYPVLATAAKR